MLTELPNDKDNWIYIGTSQNYHHYCNKKGIKVYSHEVELLIKHININQENQNILSTGDTSYGLNRNSYSLSLVKLNYGKYDINIDEMDIYLIINFYRDFMKFDDIDGNAKHILNSEYLNEILDKYNINEIISIPLI